MFTSRPMDCVAALVIVPVMGAVVVHVVVDAGSDRARMAAREGCVIVQVSRRGVDITENSGQTLRQIK